jgi:hypothetical protein
MLEVVLMNLTEFIQLFRWGYPGANYQHLTWYTLKHVKTICALQPAVSQGIC